MIQPIPAGGRANVNSERSRLFLALVAPLGVTVMGLMLGIEPLFVGGLVFTGLVLAAAVLRRMS
jgi:hypothetical protein